MNVSDETLADIYKEMRDWERTDFFNNVIPKIRIRLSIMIKGSRRFPITFAELNSNEHTLQDYQRPWLAEYLRDIEGLVVAEYSWTITDVNGVDSLSEN